MSTLRAWRERAEARLARSSPSPRVDADYLLLHVLEKDRTWLRLHDDDMLGDAEAQELDALLRRREQGEPVAYLLGERGFWTLDLAVSPATLIPRADTELLVEIALEKLPVKQEQRVLDLGTGSGAIALAVGRERPLARITAVDASAEALAVATANAKRHALSLRLLQSDWFSALGDERFDLILANPPYIAADDPHLGQGDVRYEPLSALVAGEGGLSDLRRIIEGAPSHLADGGWLAVEHGHEQGDAVRRLMKDNGFCDVETRRDIEGRERSTLGRHPRQQGGRHAE